MTQLRDSGVVEVKHAIDRDIMALDDWSALSFPEYFAPERDAIATSNVHARGLSYYIAEIAEELREARNLL